MRTIEPTTRFRRDFKREKKGRHGNRLDAMLAEVTDMLAADTPLPPAFETTRSAAPGTIAGTATSAPTSS